MVLNNPFACGMNVLMNIYCKLVFKKKSYLNVYIERFNHMFIILGFYVDGSISISNNISFLNITKMELFQAFEMTNNGEFHYYVDFQVH
jgi:hypothetical protein